MRRVVIALLGAGVVLVAVLAWPSSSPRNAPVVEEAPADPQAADALAAAPERATEPVVLTGSALLNWAVPAEVSAKVPSTRGKECQGRARRPTDPAGHDPCTTNRSEEPEAGTGARGLGKDAAPKSPAGPPVERLLGYRWNGRRFKPIPFQVDEMFHRYLSNNRSGFAFFSETDKHLSYVYDREGYKWTASAEDDPCQAAPRASRELDPVPGLDTDDELVFMARDAGPRAPRTARLPKGIARSQEVAIHDPYAPARTSYVYVMQARADGPEPSFDAHDGYVRYARDPDANRFGHSESSYESYGNAPEGPYWDPETQTCVTDPGRYAQRRPGDQATVTTPRYSFRYEGRWLMTELQVAAEDDWEYGPDLVDRWKARAFQQRPGGRTPCCGFEEEENNWGGSSILLGERSGPVRAIRETWGADSGTNVIRRETFYRDEIRQATFLRVHVIPPGDGIYAQWDYNAGRVTRYFNPRHPEGVPIDGRSDEVFGNAFVHAGPDGVAYDPDGDGGQAPISVPPGSRTCELERDLPGEHDVDACLSNDVDFPDPTFSGPNATLDWEQIAGPHGSLVTRTTLKQLTPGGTAQGLFAMPYYRDDACFDDGTGDNPGPHLQPRATDDPLKPCWSAAGHGIPEGDSDPRFRQGSIGTHGLHLLLVADSDNAGATEPLTEIDAEQRIVVLRPPRRGAPVNVGERYGRQLEKPLVAVATPEGRAPDKRGGRPRTRR